MRGVALGGGHGTAIALQALNLLCDDVTGIVSIADDGGSSGVLRRIFEIPAVGDLRRCMSATGDASIALTTMFEERIGRDQHPLGNLILAMAVLEDGDFERAVARVAALVGSSVRLLPATSAPVDLAALTTHGYVRGQVDVHRCTDIMKVSLFPSTPPVPKAVFEALDRADLIIAGPGSLFTSVLATLVVPGIAEAISTSSGRFVLLANLRPEIPESANLGLPEQLEVLQQHGIIPDVVLCDERSNWQSVSSARRMVAPLANLSGLMHDPVQIARSLVEVMAN